jgi:hypothetical protein
MWDVEKMESECFSGDNVSDPAKMAAWSTQLRACMCHILIQPPNNGLEHQMLLLRVLPENIKY